MPRTLWTAMLSICLWAASSLAGEEGVRWEVQPLLAGKASLTGDGYHVIRSLGTTQTSPDLRLPVQLFYDSASTDLGLLGHGWRIPQLESRAVPMDKNMNWTWHLSDGFKSHYGDAYN